MPAPTPTRFVGKMHMKMEEGRTQRKTSTGDPKNFSYPTLNDFGVRQALSKELPPVKWKS